MDNTGLVRLIGLIRLITLIGLITDKTIQGSHHQGKTWKTWKIIKSFSRPGKIREFEKRAKIREKSGNLKIPSGKIREKVHCATHALS